MTPLVFYIYIIISMVFGFCIGYVSTCRLSNGIIIGIILSVIVGCVVGAAIDNANIQMTATTSVANLTIVDSFQGMGFLGGNDLTVKLSNGKILHFEDPYKWKKFNVGNQYNFTIYNYVSMIEGKGQYYDYDYLGVV